MVSTEERSGKHCFKCPNSGDHNMMNDGVREMSLNVYDCDDWLVINKETSTRARNDPRAAPNPTHKAWGQPAMLGRPRTHTHDQFSWNNFHTPNGGFVCRPPNFVNSNHNGMMMGKLVGQPPLRNGLSVNSWGDYNFYNNNYGGNRSKNVGCGIPVITIDSDSSDDDDEEEDDYPSKFKNATDNNKARTKGFQGLTSDSSARPGLGPKPYTGRVDTPGVLRPGFGRGVISQPATHSLPPSCRGRDFGRDSKNISKVNCYDDGFTTEDENQDWEDDETQSNWFHHNRHPIHGQVGEDPRLGMPPPNLNFSRKLAAGVGSTQVGAARHGGMKEVSPNPSYINGTKTAFSHGYAKESPKCGVRQKYTQNPHTREGILLPGGSNPSSGAKKCKVSGKNGGKEKILSEAESSDFDDEEDSQLDDDECDELVSSLAAESFKGRSDKLGKEMEESCNVKQTSISKEDAKEKKQCSKTGIKKESDLAMDCFAGKLHQKESRKNEKSNANMLLYEDYKNMVKEVAKLVKLHITSKHEVDTCANEGEQLMKIHEEIIEMKKRHQEEEQELHMQYNATLKRFMDRKSAVDCDSDASDEL